MLIVDDHRLFADAVRHSLESNGISAVDVAATAADALVGAREMRPDLVLVDLALPDARGVELGKKMLEELPDVKLLALTALQGPEMVTEVMRAGFHGYVTKSTPLAELLPIMRAVLGGQVVLPHRLAHASVLRRPVRRTPAELLAGQLTARELGVLELLVQGVSGAEIAVRLSISPNTVRTHVQSILTKLGVHSRLEAVAFAVKHKVVDPAGDGEAAAG
ncbi:MAG: response regulator [Actinomycetota bacterium]